MQSFIHADVFFFITTISIVLLTIGFSVIIYYVIRILQDINKVSSAVREGSEEIVEGLQDLHQNIKKNGNQFKNFLKFIMSFFIKASKKSRRQSE